jgi:hypothetical protein
MNIFRWMDCALGLLAAGPLIEDLVIPPHCLKVRMHSTKVLTSSLQQQEQLVPEWLEHDAGMGSKGQLSDGHDSTKA